MIGVFGGSFDPIHFGHIKPVIKLSEEFCFEEIYLIPCFISPTSKDIIASAEHRFKMASIVCSSHFNNIKCDAREINRKGTSYSYDTIIDLKKEKNLKNSPLCLILGLDVFLNFEKWYNYRNILDEANIIVINRPNNTEDKINSMSDFIQNKLLKNKEDFLKKKNGGIYLYSGLSIESSSSNIRSMIKKGNEPTGLIPGSIWNYIKRNKLYS